MNRRNSNTVLNLFLLLILTFCSIIESHSQEYGSVQYEDGTRYHISDLDNDEENFPKHEIYFGGFINGGVSGLLGYTYTNPFSQQFKVEGGINGFSVNASHMFYSKIKEKMQKLDLGRMITGTNWTGGDNVNVYRGELPINKVISYGIGGGFEYFQIEAFDGIYDSEFDYKAKAATFGFVRIATKQVTYNIEKPHFKGKRNKRKSASSKLFVGLVYVNPSFIEDQPSEDLEFKSIVPRISYEYSVSVFPSGKGGLRFLVGFQGLYDPTFSSSFIVGVGYRRTIG